VTTIFLVPAIIEYIMLRKKRDYSSIMTLK
jgi:hypothetical protein